MTDFLQVQTKKLLILGHNLRIAWLYIHMNYFYYIKCIIFQYGL
jgi:hypothetical protein